MSALSEPTCQREGNKIRVSLILKVPIDLELELLGMPPTACNPVKGSPTGNSESAVEISREGEADFYEDIRVLSNQIVAQLLQDRQVVSTPQTQYEQDNPENQQEGTAKAELSINTWFPEREKAARQPVTAKEILEKTEQPLSNRPSDQPFVSWTSLSMVELTDFGQGVLLPTLGASPFFSEFGRTPPFKATFIRLIQRWFNFSC